MKSLEFVQKVWRNFVDAGGLDAHVLRDMKVVQAEQGRVVTELVIQKHHTV